MRPFRSFVLVCGSLIAIVGCPPASSSPTPDANAGDDDCARYCANLRRLECREGGERCPATCRRVQQSDPPMIAGFDPVCGARAASLDELRACGPAGRCTHP